MEDEMTFGSRLRHIRKSLGLSQLDLAIRMEIQPSTVCRWETDERLPGGRLALKLTETLSIARAAQRLAELDEMSAALVPTESIEDLEQLARSAWAQS